MWGIENREAALRLIPTAADGAAAHLELKVVDLAANPYLLLAAVQAVADKRWGHMVALQSPHLVTIPIDEVLKETKRVDPAHDVVQAARMMGISFGD